MDVSQHVQSVMERIRQAALAAGREPGEITLCAATKVQTDETIRAAIAAGVRVCGENRVQELAAHLAADAYAGAEQVHFIGHLQTNKVRQVVGRVELIESVGSEHLLEAIEAQAAKLELVQDILLEVNIGGEEAKSGFAPEELPQAAAYAKGLAHIRVRGLMTIPPVAVEKGGNIPYFEKVHRLFVDISREMYDNKWEYISMGMSGDYADAVRCGANMVRVGSAIFGARNYQK